MGGYAAVHGRPAAFEGADGHAYSVEPEVERSGDEGSDWGGYLLFVRWRRLGGQGVEGHVETDFLVRAPTAADAREALGRLSLLDAKVELDALIRRETESAR